MRNSILDYFLANAAQCGPKTAALVKRDGVYCEATWQQMADEARRIAAGLVALGVQLGERVCLISETRLEWILAEMGILGAGGVTVPIYPSNLPDECQYIAEDSDAVVVIAENVAQVQKFRAERARLPGVKHVVQIDGAVETQDDWVLSLDDLKARGADVDLTVLDKRRRSLTKDTLLTIIYTSGTTGRPKGVVVTHDCMIYEAEACAQIHFVDEDDVQMLWLPLAHSFARVLSVAWLSTRHVVAFAESMEQLRENLREVKPTVIAAVPRFYEKLHAAIVKKGTTGSGLRSQLFSKALAYSAMHGEAELRGEWLGARKMAKYLALKALVFRKVGDGLQEALGGRMRGLISGGAPLAPEIARFFRDAGIEIFEGYGLTETCAATTVSRPGRNRIGTVGIPLPGTQVRIADDGEVLIKGRGVMREYWKKPEATAEVLRDGWLHTGDIGAIDPDGCLRIVDRKKDIIVTAGGKNIAPQNIENLLKTHKLISQVVVHGDRRKFCSALVTLDADALSELASAKGWGNGSYAELTQRPEVHAAVQDAIGGFNRQLASYETVKRFKILEHDFSQDSGELTPTLKVKRRVINERYEAIFDSFYEEA